MPKSYTNLLYHIVFSTKDRQPIIIADYQSRLYDYIGGIIRGQGGISLGINGIEDHVHVLAKLRPDKSLSDVLRDGLEDTVLHNRKRYNNTFTGGAPKPAQ